MQRFSVVLVGLTWLLVVLGGIVHNTGSSLACPDWPLCNGSAFPQMVGPVLIEHGHRLTALAVVVGTMILLVWTARARDPGAIKIAGVALALVIVQALLGAITVKLRLPPIVSTGHLATSMLFFSTVIYLAFRLRQSAAPQMSARAQGMTLATSVLIYAQMVLGAAVRHLGAGLVCREWWCSLSGDYTLQLHMAHRIVAALVLIFSVATAVVVFRAGRARLLALALPLLVIAQMTLGLLTITSFRDFVPLTAHLAVAALLFACAVSLHLIARGPLATSSDEVTLPARSHRVSVAAVRTPSFVADVIALGKPRITVMVLVTTMTGLYLAPGQLPLGTILATLVGVTLVVAGANALNMYLERDVDALMTRTRNRPLPAGRLHPQVALAFGIATSAIAVPLLALRVNPLTGFLAALSLVLYVLAYTPLKRRSTAALIVGAVPGAMPPLLGWTASTGVLGAPGLALFLILFVWQLPHFLAISIFRADEYARAGLKVVPSVRGVGAAKLQIGLYSLLMLAVSLQVVRVGIGGAFYLATALALGGGLVTLGAYGLGRGGDQRWARWYFLYTLVYLPALLIALALSHR